MTDLGLKILTAQSGKMHLFYTGQAGFILKSPEGCLVAVDLYLSECVERLEESVGFKRLIPKVLNPFECSFDAVIATHPHWDHFDVDSIPILISVPKTILFASVNCEVETKKQLLDSRKIKFVKPGDFFSCRDIDIKFVPCDHGSETPDAVGVILKVAGKNIYIAGDTCLRMDYVPKILDNGVVDILIAPINGAYGNMNEKECAEFAAALKTKLVIPCHYGMFAAHGGDLGKFINIMNEEYPSNKYYIMAVGEQLTL